MNKLKTQITSANHRAILLIHCPDQKGIVAAISDFLSNNQGNIIYLEQHVDIDSKVFFMRIEWELAHFSIPSAKIADYFQTLIAAKYEIRFTLFFSDEIPRMALFVSKLPHCLFDILSRTQSGEWNVEIPLIISNHSELEVVANQFGIDFYYLPINKQNKADQELKQMQLLIDYRIDFVVLARYMQIISSQFIQNYPNRIINIHHSFLPAFPGAKPYHQAHQRGVKIIGATSHYVTEDLDEGPIIEQDVAKITHKESVENLVRKGKDLEKFVLSRAIAYHLEHRVLVYGNRTIVFE